ncbi:hypothetical protein [Burkholderia gladioli]|uniref:glycine-rich domain-containing protein n=1 Tax=Burkholderia gladioli TaxID=28095 RepID=UPI0030CF8A49
MRRVETYIGQQVYEWLFSSQAQQTMVAIAKLSAALLGTSTVVRGLGCTPTAPAGMTVQIAKGEIYAMENLEATACGTLPADTTNQILKQGIQLGTYTTPAFAAPVTSGQSINYLVEVQYQDQDISLDPTTGAAPVVLQFYNAASPTTPWAGPGNSGATSNTFRDGIVAYQIKAGIPATTGSQTTPSPDTGWTGLWVVTVAFGQTSITSANISQYAAAPVLPSGILQSIQTGNLNYGVDAGAVNALAATFPVPPATLTDNQIFWVKVANSNTGATTFTPNPGVISAAPVVGMAQSALQGGELVAGGRAMLVWRADISSFVLMYCSGAAMQIGSATQSGHAVTLGQLRQIKTIAVFTSNGTFTVPAGVLGIWITATAGGGGGGAGGNTTGLSSIVGGGGGGGGGAGQFLIRAFFAVTPGQVISITVGAGGFGGVAGGATATAGGNTVIGTLATLTGGSPGSTGATATVNSTGGGGIGGNGGAGSPAGNDGSDGNYAGNGGAGGSSPLGGGGAGGRAAQLSGRPGTSAAPGGGGGGGGGCYGTGAGTAGNGGPGGQSYVLIEC